MNHWARKPHPTATQPQRGRPRVRAALEDATFVGSAVGRDVAGGAKGIREVAPDQVIIVVVDKEGPSHLCCRFGEWERGHSDRQIKRRLVARGGDR